MNNNISGLQLYSISIFMIIATAILYEPRHMIQMVQNNAWVLPFLSGIWGLLFAGLYAQLIKSDPAGFVSLVESLVGKWAGRVIVFLYLGYTLFHCALSLRLFTDFVLSVVDVFLPVSVLTAVFLGASAWAVRRGVPAVARLSELCFWGNSLFALVILLAIARQLDWHNLLPVLPGGILPLARGAWQHAYIYGEAFWAVLLVPFIANRNKAHVPLLVSVLFSMFWLGSFTLFIIAYFNHWLAAAYTFPFFSLVRGIYLGEFIQRLDILLVTIWINNTIIKTSVLLLVFAHTAAAVVHLRDYRPLVLPGALVVGPLSILIFNNIVALQQFYDRLLYLVVLVFTVAIPLVLFLISLWRRGESHAQKTGSPTACS